MNTPTEILPYAVEVLPAAVNGKGRVRIVGKNFTFDGVTYTETTPGAYVNVIEAGFRASRNLCAEAR